MPNELPEAPKTGKLVLVLQHIECESLGILEDLLKSSPIDFRYVRSYAGDPVPIDMSTASALIVLGGPMGVYEQDQFPFLTEEIRLIQQAVREQKPVLGICLGSQLLAAALGAKVEKGLRKEIGWYPVFFSSQAREDKLLAQTDEGYMLHWHGDVFNLPEGAVALASSDWTQIQAFRFDEKAYGFLFHMELTEAMIRSWVIQFADELKSSKIDPETILSGIPRYLRGLNAIGRRVFNQWLGLI